MLLPIFIADRSFWNGDEPYHTMVDVSLHPIPTRSTWLPSGNRCDWTGGDQPTTWITTPAGTKIEQRMNYDPYRLIRRLPKTDAEPEKLTLHEAPDYPTAIVRYGRQEHDAETMLRAAIEGGDVFKVVDGPVGDFPRVADSPHQLTTSFAKTRHDLMRRILSIKSTQRPAREDTPEGLIIDVYGAWEVSRIDDEVIWKSERLSFEPIEGGIETEEGDPETVFVSRHDVVYRILAPANSILDPKRGVMSPGQAATPQPWASCPYSVTAMACRRVNGYEWVEGEERYQFRKQWIQRRKPDAAEATPDQTQVPATNLNAYPSDTKIETRQARTRGVLPGQLSLF